MALGGIRADCQGACVTKRTLKDGAKMYLEEVSRKIRKGFFASPLLDSSCMTPCVSEDP